MRRTPAVGTHVVVNDLPDATVFEVVETNGPRVGIKPVRRNPKEATQWVDRSILIEVDKEIEPTTDRCFLVLGYNSWGKGKTEAEAIKQWKAQAFTGGQREVKAALIDAPANCRIDPVDGQVLRHPDSPASKKLRDVTIKM